MAQSPATRWSRRHFLEAAGLAGAGFAVGLPRRADAQGALKSITASHSVSTFVYGQHLVAAQKKFFEESVDADLIHSARFLDASEGQIMRSTRTVSGRRWRGRSCSACPTP
jgi:hypothetical protein